MSTPDSERGRSGGQRTSATAQWRVLVVDDNQIIRVALSGVIRQDPSLVVMGEAATGEMALQSIQASQPDLVCLDVLMPGMGGLATLKRIREEHPAVRSIIITGASTPDVVKEALALGAKGFIVKPFNAHKVLTVIRNARISP